MCVLSEKIPVNFDNGVISMGNIVGFRGVYIQRGYDIGDIFKRLARIAIPLFKRGAKAVGKRALKAATEIDQDVLEGKDVIKSAKLRGNRQSVIWQKRLPTK